MLNVFLYPNNIGLVIDQRKIFAIKIGTHITRIPIDKSQHAKSTLTGPSDKKPTPL